MTRWSEAVAERVVKAKTATYGQSDPKRAIFFVNGVPIPQGSTRAFIPKGWKRAIITTANRNLHQWRTQITAAAPPRIFFDGAVALSLAFTLPRPASLPKKVRDHLKKPDLDKLIRACGDALTSVLWRDDSQVVSIHATKVYGDRCGVQIDITDCS